MERKRLVIYKSNSSIEAQIIDEGKTLIGKKFTFKGKDGISQSVEFGKQFAELAKEKKIVKINFDRNGSRYHGRVKAFAEGLREAGLEF